jgi:protein arginine N-methyltransferase 1
VSPERTEYSVADFGAMMADGPRVEAYAEALRRTVRPGSVVLDIGAGTGLFAMLACRCGAGRVYAVEVSEVIQLAREIAAANGFGDRITFLETKSRDVTLPERADVIVSDLRGSLPLFEHTLPALADARKRLLAPGGVLVPLRDDLQVAVIEAPEFYEKRTGPWKGKNRGFDMRAGLGHVTSIPAFTRRVPGKVLLPARRWASVDYTSLSDPGAAGTVAWTAERRGTGHGLLLWFDTLLAEGVAFSNAPGSPDLVYGRAFFPWPSPVPIEAGDRIEVSIRADLVGEDYLWRWETKVRGGGEPEIVRADFRQSTFNALPRSPESLRKQAETYVPTLSGQGEAELFVLGLMDGRRSLVEIAARLRERFPDRFPTGEEALALVGRISLDFT